jgi:hypothetical protein
MIVKQEEHGEHLEYVEVVAAELFRAKQCLFNADAKLRYDTALRTSLAPQANEPVDEHASMSQTNAWDNKESTRPLREEPWEAFYGSHFLGAVKAKDEESAIKAALLAFGQHLRGAIKVSVKSARGSS